MSALRTASGPSSSSAQRSLRRLIMYTLLFALVVIGAIGLSGLLGRLLATGTALAGGDVAGVARSLAFTLIGGPLAGLLWWAVWKRLDDETERSSAGWALYVAGAYAVSLITFSNNLLGLLSSLLESGNRQWSMPLANGVVWAAVWVWHRWMWRHPGRSPLRLADVPVPTVAGVVYGLIIGIGGAIAALSTLLDTAIRGFTDSGSLGRPWWVSALQGVVWAAGGTLVWWWHWIREGGRQSATAIANVALIVVGILAASVLALGGAGTTLFVLLRLAFDRAEATNLLLEPLAPALAAGLVGALVWAYHRTMALQRPATTRQAATLVTSGVALAAAATGIGVIVNSTLGIAAPTLAGTGLRTLLLGGISSLVVGAPVWWLIWKPRTHTDPGAPGSTGRRVYLIAVFGISAVVALITLLVIGYRLFEYLLENVTGGSLVDRVRAPLGLLVATGLAAGYHFSVWRHDRSVLAAAAPARRRTIGQVILVTAAEPGPLSRAIAEATGANVTVWRRADVEPTRAAGQPGPAAAPTEPHAVAGQETVSVPEPEAVPEPDSAQLARALDGVSAQRVLIVAGPGSRIEVIPLES